MTRTLQISAWPLVALVLVNSTLAWADEPAEKKPASTQPAERTAKEPRVLVTISKETTFITGPLRQDGNIDYIEALNQRMSQGVTPENNAAVPFWRAIGPEPVPEEVREEYFRRLEIKVPPAKGEYFVTFGQFLRGRSPAKESPTPDEEVARRYSQQNDAMARPWSAQEFPDVAAWLRENEKPLALMVSGSKRPRRYNPSLPGLEGTVMSVRIVGQDEYRDVARALAARAMLRVHADQLDEAWDDLLACHRWARLEGQGWPVVEGLIGIATESIATDAEALLLQHRQLTAKQAAKMRNDLAQIMPRAKMVEKLNLGERFLSLDMTSMLAREGLSSLWKLTDVREPAKKPPQIVNKELIDWDLILHETNAWYDQVVQAIQQPTRKERIDLLNAFDDAVKHHIAEQKRSFLSAMWVNPQQGFSRFMSAAVNGMMLPAITAVNDIEDRATMRFELTRLGFALAEYRADQGSYPDKLDDLVPKYLPAIPRDLFNDGELRYERKGAGYELYSVGPNGEDDGGSEDDSMNQDDLAIRIQAAKKP